MATALPMPKWQTAPNVMKEYYRLGVLTIGSKDIVLEYTVLMASGDGERSRRCSLERLHQRLRREGLCKIGEASRLKRKHPDGRIVVPSDVDDRHRNASSFELLPQLDARRPIVQIDVKNDAKRLFEIVMVLKGFGRCKQDAVVTVCPQQSLYSPEHPGVIIDDKNEAPIR